MELNFPKNFVPEDLKQRPGRSRSRRRLLSVNKMQTQKAVYERRVLTQVQVTDAPIIEEGQVLSVLQLVPPPVVQLPPVLQPQPVIERGPVLYSVPAPAEHQHPPPSPPVVRLLPSPVALPPPMAQQSQYQSLTPAAASPQAVPQVPDILAIAGIAEEFMELNSSNAAKFVSEHGDILQGVSPCHWHEITIKTPVLESKRKFVILAINKQISPLKLFPYFFHMKNNCITFFVNLCGSALKKLCSRDLKVPYVSDKFVEIEMTVRLFCKYFNLSEALKEIVSRRLDSQKKFLDLSYFMSIPEVQEMLFDPTDTRHILEQLMRIGEVVAPGLAVLGLAGNGIKSLRFLWDFLVCSKWKSLRTLDLSDNEILETGTVPSSRTLQISELYMDRNPICRIHYKAGYISTMRAAFPHVAKLDGTYLHITARLPSWKPNFIVGSASDSGDFVDQFLEHFFTLYDDADRMKLRGLYHENACFSLNCVCLDAQLTTPNARLTAYMAETRNLLRCSDMKKVRAALTRGSENVLERLSNLPTTQHDPYSFAVDLTVHTPEFTVLTVAGVFRDIAKEKSSHRHFSRTFVLTGRGNGEFQITNDILYISNATTREAEEAFKFARAPKKMKNNRPVPNLSESEKESMTRMVQQLTSMSAPWSRKCLEDTDWDLKEALQIFVELYEPSKIPKSAFVSWKE